MSIAEKLIAVAENERKVYNAGVTAERKTMYDVFQDNGGTQNYYYAFAVDRFTDENYNPQHDIKCSSGTTPAQKIFYNATRITDTKVPIYANSKGAEYCFQGATGLVTIVLLSVYETTVLTGTFAQCESLVDLTMDGIIGQDINLQWSTKLSKASIESVVEHLSDVAEGKTATFSKTAVLAAFGTAEAWSEYIASKPNWTFTLV